MPDEQEPRDRAHMKKLKELLGKTETEIYLMEGGVPDDLKQAYEKDNNIIEGKVVEATKLDDAIKKLEDVRKAADPEYKARWECYSKRLQGWSVAQLAEEQYCSPQLIYLYLQWCMEQLPALKDFMEEFTTLSLSRLDMQYRQLAIARAKGDVIAHKVSLDIIDQQAKLVGAHKMSVQVDNRVTYVLEGVDMEDL
jgi:hypothetical protein